jgi:CubicO group peptidase (beta-lactamase class C family)
MTTTELEGHVLSGFDAVADEFAANFSKRGDTAASCAIYVGGTLVVDLWAGTTTEGPWTPDARTVVFSVSKGITAVCVLMAVEAGHLELDAPVTDVWPEFGAQGKHATTLRQILAHRAGLPAPEVDVTAAQLRSWDPVARALAEQAPAWSPGTSHAYHAMTVGWLAGELLRRSTGKRPNQWLAEHIARPLGVSLHYGTGGTTGEHRDIRAVGEPLPDTDTADMLVNALLAAEPVMQRAMSMGGVFDPEDMAAEANRQQFLECEMPAANLIGSARALAKTYAACVGPIEGTRLLTEDTVRDALAVQSQGVSFLGIDDGHRWGTGFMLDSPRRGMAGPGSFGHDGLGGQLAFAHLPSQVAFAYHAHRPGGPSDGRAEALCRALRTCL